MVLTHAAQNRLIQEHNETLVPAIASEYRGKGIDYEDLLASGTLGLVKAAREYDPDHISKSSFTNYAINRIRAEIFNAVEAEKSAPPGHSDHIEKIWEFDCWGDRGNASMISEGWTSLDASPEELALYFDAIKDRNAKFEEAFMSLTGNQRKLITWVYLSDQVKPIVQAARDLGVSYWQAIRMLNKALKVMREVIIRIENNRISGGNSANELRTKTIRRAFTAASPENYLS